MLRNYPRSTSFGFILWFVLISAASAIINYPVVRIIAYTSLIFYAVIQGWSIHETYLQEKERSERNEEAHTSFLSKEEKKKLKILIYACLTFAMLLSITSVFLSGISVPVIIAAAFIAALFFLFVRFDKAKELQTAREISMSTAVIILFFVLMLPLSFKANILAAVITAFGMYLAAFGIDRSTQKIVRLTLADFKDMEEMEKSYYDDIYVTPAEEAYKWYDVYPYTTVACKKGNTLAGFINLFPVKEEVSKQLKEGTFNDASMELGDIKSIVTINPEKRTDLFLCCIVVDEEFRDDRIADELLYDSLIQYEDIYHCIDQVYADTVTDDGRRFVEKIGFTPLCESSHNSHIYKMDFKSFKDYVLALYSVQEDSMPAI